MNAVKPPVSSCSWRSRSRCSIRSASVSTWPNIIVAVLRPPSSCQTRFTLSQSSVITLPRVIAVRTRSTRISAPPPGRLPRPAAFSRSSTVAQRQLRDLREVVNLRRAEAVDVDLRKARLDVAQQFFVPLELVIGMQAALHQNLIAAERDRLCDLLQQLVARRGRSLRRDFGVR